MITEVNGRCKGGRGKCLGKRRSRVREGESRKVREGEGQ